MKIKMSTNPIRINEVLLYGYFEFENKIILFKNLHKIINK